ncbi:fimbrial biogenesis usher protein [Escherichia marmotae]|uniref:fimbrial biogenesis usher protein n=1 Tax=Escherichia ruysiae TaxID=2608867 RepID=UPI001C9AE8E5|nr:fimbrial biogenesis usher protein [Escherichia ruysiae]MBY7359895.1 fimbrial biogenesis usher protein [Escherichia ruysiae]MBY7619779.1 fimbrial biogenesis usher protein [Escherichia marmotae]
MLKKSLLAYSIGLLTTLPANASDLELAAVDFDRNTLKSLGIDPAVSHYFSRSARFMPGEYSLMLNVNGDEIGNIIVRIDNNGDACLDKNVLEFAGLKIPASSDENGCYDYPQSYPGTKITPLTNQDKLQITVPPQARIPLGQDVTSATTGGHGALLNYSLLSSRSEFGNDSSDFSQAVLEGGININDWMLRSHQFITQSDGNFSNQNSTTYLEHTFVGSKMLMRAGEVNVNNTLLEGARIYGIELSPDSALQHTGSGVQVTGIANTFQARVEIRQQGVLLLSTLVPAGAFTISDVPVRTMNSDLQVNVIETTGGEHTFSVPATLFNNQMVNGQGYRISLGRVDSSYDDSPWVLSASDSWNLTTWSNFGGGAIVADSYQAIAARTDIIPLPDLSLGSQISSAWDNNHSLHGQKYQLDVNYNLPYALGVNSSISYQDHNYRTLSESTDNDGESDWTKSTLSLGISWSDPTLGGVNVSGYKTQSYDGRSDSTNLSVNWNKSFKHATVSVNWQHQLDASEDNEDDGDLFYVNISIPFGRSSSTTLYTRHDDHRTYYGGGVSGAISDETSYYVSAERNQDEQQNTINGSLNTNLHYTQLSLAASANNEDNRSYNGMLSGGIALHSQGVTLSPWAIDDTYAIARLDNAVSGVKISTPTGSVWTDIGGKAVIPSLQPWRKATIEIDTTSLPKNVDVGNGTKMLKQSRGAVGKVGFNTLTQRRALLTIAYPDGKKLPQGMAIQDSDGNYLTTSVDEGTVFLNNVKPEMTIIAVDGNRSCRISLFLPAEAPDDIFYETATGVCQ